MKKIICFCLLVSAISSQASVMVQNNKKDFCRNNVFEAVGLCYTISTTTSLPTLIVEGVEVDLNSPEAQERLEAEMRGDIEPVLLNELRKTQE